MGAEIRVQISRGQQPGGRGAAALPPAVDRARSASTRDRSPPPPPRRPSPPRRCVGARRDRADRAARFRFAIGSTATRATIPRASRLRRCGRASTTVGTTPARRRRCRLCRDRRGAAMTTGCAIVTRALVAGVRMIAGVTTTVLRAGRGTRTTWVCRAVRPRRPAIRALAVGLRRRRCSLRTWPDRRRRTTTARPALRRRAATVRRRRAPATAPTTAVVRRRSRPRPTLGVILGTRALTRVMTRGRVTMTRAAAPFPLLRRRWTRGMLGRATTRRRARVPDRRLGRAVATATTIPTLTRRRPARTAPVRRRTARPIRPARLIPTAAVRRRAPVRALTTATAASRWALCRRVARTRALTRPTRTLGATTLARRVAAARRVGASVLSWSR